MSTLELPHESGLEGSALRCQHTASQPETNLYRFTTAVLLHRIASLADCRFDALISPEPLHSYDLLFFIIYIYRYGEEQS